MIEMFNCLRFILEHPLNRGHKIRAICRLLGWQIKCRITKGIIVVPFVNNSKLLISCGMRGATGNIYCGLHDFEEMAFLLHLLKEGDLFIDVGANVGAYTVLAAAVRNAKCISVEPIKLTFQHLMENVRLNAIAERVTAMNVGVASRDGKVMYTTSRDTNNHVVRRDEKGLRENAEVDSYTLNHLAGHLNPVLIKIDVEGFELSVIDGAEQVLNNSSLLALIIENNEGVNPYGFSMGNLHRRLSDYGFTPHRYEPFERRLFVSDKNITDSNNVLYVRRGNVALINERLIASEHFFVKRIRKNGI